MDNKNIGELTSRYYGWEKSVYLSALALIAVYWGWDGMLTALSIQFQIGGNPGALAPRAIACFLLIATFFMVVEWKQSNKTARKNGWSLFRFAFAILVAIVSVILNLPMLASGTDFAEVPRIWYAIYLILGIAVGICFSPLLLATLMIRPVDETKKSIFRGRIPVAAKAQYILWGPLLVIMVSVLLTANHYAHPAFLKVGLFIFILPILITIIGDINLFFFSRDSKGNRISYRQQVTELRKIHDMHEYGYILADMQEEIEEAYKEIGITEKMSPREKQEAMRKYFHHKSNQQGNVPLRPRIVLPPEMIEYHMRKFIEIHAQGRDLSTDDTKKAFSSEMMEYAFARSVKEVISQEATVHQLYLAAHSGDVAQVKKCLADGHDIEQRAPSGGTPLLIAVANGHTQIVKLLLEKGAMPDASNFLYRTPLMYAACYGNVEIAKILIDFGARLNLQDDVGNTALAVAVGHGNTQVVRLLLAKGAQIKTINMEKQSPIDLAYMAGRGDIARLLKKEKKERKKRRKNRDD